MMVIMTGLFVMTLVICMVTSIGYFMAYVVLGEDEPCVAKKITNKHTDKACKEQAYNRGFMLVQFSHYALDAE